MESLPEDGDVFFHIHTVLRENALELYGFIGKEEKALFEMLLAVTGIGPRMALTILSGISPDRFQDAVLQRDFRRLTAIPGIGKKSAERIVLELTEKLIKAGEWKSCQSTQNAAGSLEDDLVSSLLNLGYKDRVARAAAKQVLVRDGSAHPSLEDAVKAALKVLTK
jgi:Holliday junction DNA helicase RuvA